MLKAEKNFEESTQTLLPELSKEGNSAKQTPLTHSLSVPQTLAVVAGVTSQQYDFESSRYKDQGNKNPQATVNSFHLNAIASMSNNSR